MATAQKEAKAGPVASYHNEATWLEERSRRLTGSKIAAIFGQHPYVTAADVQREALHGPQGQDETPIMRRGKLLEPIAVEEYERATGRVTRRVPMKVWSQDALFAASVDRQVLAGDSNATGALEVKVPGWQVFTQIRRQGILPYMIFQGQLESMVFGYDFTSFAILHADSFRMLTFDLEADRDFQAAMVARGREWWARHVINREPVADAAPPEKLPEVSGELVLRSDTIFAEAARDLLDARDIRKEAEAIETDAKIRLKATLGGFGAFEGAGARVYYRLQQGRVTKDWKALERTGAIDPAKLQAWLTRIGDETGVPILVSELREAADELRLDLTQFETRGAPYEELRPYRVKAQAEE